MMGSFTTLQLMMQARETKHKYRIILWILASSVTLGCCAIWSMHFIAMISVSMKIDGVIVPVVYVAAPTILSAFIACISCAIGLGITALHLLIPPLGRLLEKQHRIATLKVAPLLKASSESVIKHQLGSLFQKSNPEVMSVTGTPHSIQILPVALAIPAADVHVSKIHQLRNSIKSIDYISLIKRSILGDLYRPSIFQILFAAIFTACGVCAMHYYGMVGMKADHIHHSYNAGLVALSVIIAYIASAAALWLAYNLRGEIQNFISSFVMGCAGTLFLYFVYLY
jgi:NO-binding membrane sensor protein with MHYT domain